MSVMIRQHLQQPLPKARCKEHLMMHAAYALRNFHKVILQWCNRSANCPMCWQPVSLNDATSQNLLEVIEHERSLKANRSRNPTTIDHSTPANIDLHLAAAATMRSRQHFFWREGQRVGFSSQGHRPFLFFSASSAPDDASVSSSIIPIEGGSRSDPVSSFESASIIINSSTRNTETSASLSPSPMNEFSIRRGRSNVTSTYQPTFLSETRSIATQSSEGSHNTVNLQSSESLRSRLNTWSMRYRESIARSTRDWKERLFARNTSMAGHSSDVQSQGNSGICDFSRIMERLDSRINSHASGASHAGRRTRNGNLDE